MLEIIKAIGLSTILDYCGIFYKEHRKSYSFKSPFRDEKKPSGVLYKNSCYFVDFGGENMSIFKFFTKLTGQRIKEIWPDFFQNINHQKLYIKRTIKKIEKKEITISIKGAFHSLYENKIALNYCYERGMTDQFIKEFDIVYCKHMWINKTLFTNRVLIPIIENNKIISYEGRDYTKLQNPKVLYPEGGSVSTLFNIDKLDTKKTLIITEGLMDLIKIYLHITKNVTSTFGIKVTDIQKNLLSKFSDIILFPDDDRGGENFIDTFDTFYSKNFRIAKVLNKDPGESTLEEIRTALKDSVMQHIYLINKTQIFENKKSFRLF